MTLNQRAPATPVTARPTPRASARTMSLRAMKGTSVRGSLLGPFNDSRIRCLWVNCKDFLRSRFGVLREWIDGCGEDSPDPAGRADRRRRAPAAGRGRRGGGRPPAPAGAAAAAADLAVAAAPARARDRRARRGLAAHARQ